MSSVQGRTKVQPTNPLPGRGSRRMPRTVAGLGRNDVLKWSVAGPREGGVTHH
jgi:hypothetical protein